MIRATASLESVSPYSQSRPHDTPKKAKETADDHEKRTWRARLHCTPDGQVFIPPMAFKNCLSEAAKYLAIQVPGKGKTTYTKHFEAGVIVTDGLDLGVAGDEVPGEWLFLNADDRRGGGRRVWKCYPRIAQWRGAVTFHVIDPAITEEIFARVLNEAGALIGIGRFRPRNNGFYGRFTVENIEWAEA